MILQYYSRTVDFCTRVEDIRRPAAMVLEAPFDSILHTILYVAIVRASLTKLILYWCNFEYLSFVAIYSIFAIYSTSYSEMLPTFPRIYS